MHAIEVEPEVRTWLELLPDRQYRKVEEYADLLSVHGVLTPMPFARPLRDGVFELRPTLDGVATRVTYWKGSTARPTRRTSAVHPRRGRGRVMNHARWKLARDKEATTDYAEPAEIEAERAEIRLAMAFAKAVYDRRKELGLSQSELAERAGLTQAKISRVEGADAVPTLPLLRRLARALDASLNIALGEDHEEVTFVARRAA
ncbi:helix-turn-helix domain-containing protein [Streptomyces sp. NPDC051366]|uniref:helix-turn-helix domain-containing protein n=1 Tax=Streptomyces sp. NPDC051366 TaxID=3365652 RepID=UPI00378CDA48